MSLDPFCSLRVDEYSFTCLAQTRDLIAYSSCSTSAHICKFKFAEAGSQESILLQLSFLPSHRREDRRSFSFLSHLQMDSPQVHQMLQHLNFQD